MRMTVVRANEIVSCVEWLTKQADAIAALPPHSMADCRTMTEVGAMAQWNEQRERNIAAFRNAADLIMRMHQIMMSECVYRSNARGQTPSEAR